MIPEIFSWYKPYKRIAKDGRVTENIKGLFTWETWVCLCPTPIQTTSDHVSQGNPSIAGESPGRGVRVG
jgi:hypothetical protein